MELVCHAYDSTYIQDENEGLHLWCLDRDSIPIHILIKNAPIYLYIELPENPIIDKWDNDAVDLLYENFIKVHGKCAPFMMEFTERQKLYYYKGDEKTPMARLFFKSMKDMNICTSRLKKTTDYPDFGNIIFKIYEKEISIRRKVFTIRKTRYCQWMKIKNFVEISSNSPNRMATEGVEGRKIREFIINDYNDIYPIDPSESSSWATHPRILSFDIETYSDNHHALPDRNNSKHVIYMISCLYQVSGDINSREKYIIMSSDCNPIEGATIIKAEDEEELLELFLQLIDKLDPEIMMGYNIFGYDYPYIDARWSRYRSSYEPCSRLLGHIPQFSDFTWSSGAYGQTVISYLNMPGRISIDLYPLIKRDYKFDKYTLDFVSGQLLGASKHDVTAIQMFEAFESQNKECMTRVTKYCIQDANLVIDLYEKMNVWIGLVEMANIVGVEIMELFTRGQQIRCVSQIYDLTHRSKIVLNSRDNIEMKYQGGFVGDPIKGLHENVLCLDFSSLYPSIMRAYNICYTTLIPAIYYDDYSDNEVNIIETEPGVYFKFIKAEIRKGVLPQLVENLVDERNNVRKEIKKIQNKLSETTDSKIKKQMELTIIVLDKRQLGLKVSANSMYGFLGVQNGGKLPLIEGAVSITAKGRQLITQVNDYLIKKYNATVVYNDTDSSMITIPAIKDISECNKWGNFLADDISGKPEIKDASGKVIQEEVKGLFPPPLKMEYEKGMRFLGVTKKKYAAFLINDDGSFIKDRDGEEVIYKRGIVIARRDNFPYLRQKYTEILRSILRKNSIEQTFKIILNSVIEILSGTLKARGNLTIIRGMSKEYKSKTYFMKVFADELARMHHPIAAGDRLEYVVVKTENEKEPLGRRLRLIDMYEDSINFEESEDNPRPSDVYPVEPIDYMYYLTNGIQNPFDQLFNSGYINDIYKTTLHQKGYNPKNSSSKPISIATPIKLITAMIKDNLRKGDKTLEECVNYLRDEFYDWFLEMLKESKPFDGKVEIEDFEDDDEVDEIDFD